LKKHFTSSRNECTVLCILLVLHIKEYTNFLLSCIVKPFM